MIMRSYYSYVMVLDEIKLQKINLTKINNLEDQVCLNTDICLIWANNTL